MEDQKLMMRSALEVIGETYPDMFAAERKVADYILANTSDALTLNVSSLAKRSGVSDATVIRMCHRLGYTGYYQFRIALATTIGTKQFEKLSYEEAADAVQKQFYSYAETMINIGKSLDVNTMVACAKLIKECNYAHLMAVGNTCPLAQYMGFRLGRLGTRSTYNVATEYFFNNINLAEEGDILIAISQSGSSKQIIQGLELGKSKKLKSIAITAYEDSEVARIADYVLLSSGSKGEFSYYKDYSHLNETAVIDALLNFVTDEEVIQQRRAYEPEIILSESKI
ncbi:MAG: MurR/RpiR family transcriptional regulator [Eubacteriales bacterium]|nr:MurR/RpiR family transcriptional regulator [Eubacteriales bacterium]